VAAVVAVLFGIATMISGGRVLTGSADPGYVVFRPLLVFNTAMGAAYLAAGISIWRGLRRGTSAAATVFALNLAALVAIGLLYMRGRGVALESLWAMTFRTIVWLGLFATLAVAARSRDVQARP
jgi:hypothetical protein